MKNNFIPYPEALALKELRFNEECLGYYGCDKKFNFNIVSKNEMLFLNSKLTVNAPLYLQTFKFFRDKYKLSSHCDLKNTSHIKNNYYFKIVNFSDYISEDTTLIIDGFSTYEEAELQSLKKLIELCKK